MLDNWKQLGRKKEQEMERKVWEQRKEQGPLEEQKLMREQDKDLG